MQATGQGPDNGGNARRTTGDRAQDATGGPDVDGKAGGKSVYGELTPNAVGCQFQDGWNLAALQFPRSVCRCSEIGNNERPYQRCSAGTAAKLFDERAEFMCRFTLDRANLIKRIPSRLLETDTRSVSCDRYVATYKIPLHDDFASLVSRSKRFTPENP